MTKLLDRNCHHGTLAPFGQKGDDQYEPKSTGEKWLHKRLPIAAPCRWRLEPPKRHSAAHRKRYLPVSSQASNSPSPSSSRICVPPVRPWLPARCRWSSV
ncbi:MAG: hypothetical protein RLZZ341_2543, partial [Pseudomonadota bacterium]